MARGIPESTRNCVKKLWSIGKSYHEVASITGVSVSSVRRICEDIDKPTSTGTNNSIPLNIWQEWDKVTAMLRRK